MKAPIIILFVSIFLSIIILLLIIGKIAISQAFNMEVKELLSKSPFIHNKKFSYTQLKGLPTPVQRYFKYVLKEGQPYISTIKLTHDGVFKNEQNKNWFKIKGEQYFTISEPGFVWKGVTNLFTARDMFISGEGRLIVKLLSLFSVVDGKGINYNQGELLRWLSESIWFPTNLLPSDRLKWSPINENTARIDYNYSDALSVYLIVTFNSSGKIIQFETKRYFGENNLQTWICSFSDYKDINNILIPTKAEASWNLSRDNQFSYARFNVISIKYDIHLIDK